MKKTLLFSCLLTIGYTSIAQINSSDVYWVGHSLISHTDQNHSSSYNLMTAFENLSSATSKTHTYHQHTTPGAPIGWNWGATSQAWSSVQTVIDPLLNTSNPNYGSYDVMVVTEGVNLQESYDYWASGFYARKFYLAGRASNPNMRLFLYESWHHFNAADLTYASQYGPQAQFDWRQYMVDIRETWEDILEESADPSLTPAAPSNYTYNGPGTDPGVGSDVLTVNIIPTGQVLVEVLDRLLLNAPSDDWSFSGGVNGTTLAPEDFFHNPLADFPNDLTTPIHSGQQIDDIHPSQVLVYLNALVHYAVIYQEDPSNLPTLNGVPSNIADIFKEEVWDVVTNDPLTGVGTVGIEKNGKKKINVYPNPAINQITIKNVAQNALIKVIDQQGKELISSYDHTISLEGFSAGMYFVQVGSRIEKLIVR